MRTTIHETSLTSLEGLASPWPRPGDQEAATARSDQSAVALVVLALIAVAAMIVGSVVLAAGSHHLRNELGTTVYVTYLAAAPVLVGLVWRVRRADSPIGPLLILFGLSAWALAFQASADPTLFAIGVVAGQSAVLAWTIYLALAFPGGRLRGPLDGGAMVLAALAIVAFVIWASQAQTLEPGAFARCFADCPANPFRLGDSPVVASVAGTTAVLAGLASAAGVFAVVIGRMVRAGPRWRASLPVAATSLLLSATFIALLVGRFMVGTGDAEDGMVSAMLLAAAIAFPIGFLADLVRTDYAGRTAMQRLLDRLASPDHERWRDALADALGDPSLRFVVWDRGTSSYRDECGCTVDPADSSIGQAWVHVRRGREPVAAILVDRGVLADPQIVMTARNATLLATELLRTRAELDDLRVAVGEAAEAARTQIGRDLHDSAQQRLIALRIHVEVARERVDRPDDRRMLDEIGAEIERALAEVRSVAHLDGPTDLRAHGLPVALRKATRSAGVTVRVDANVVPRCDPAVERAVYYTCLEAVQNAAKHAGRGTQVRIRIAARTRGLAFSVTDDGRGMAFAARTGAGLEIMRARIRGIGGRLWIVSPPRRGTTVVGLVPFVTHAGHADARNSATAGATASAGAP
jgi:signal transduction histidine kinase